jgi:hypothetical protein
LGKTAAHALQRMQMPRSKAKGDLPVAKTKAVYYIPLFFLLWFSPVDEECSGHLFRPTSFPMD